MSEPRDTCDQSCRYTAVGHVSHGFACTDKRLLAVTAERDQLRQELGGGDIYRHEKDALRVQLADAEADHATLTSRLTEAEGLLRAWLLTAWHEEYKLVTDTRAFLSPKGEPPG